MKINKTITSNMKTVSEKMTPQLSKAEGKPER